MVEVIFRLQHLPAGKPPLRATQRPASCIASRLEAPIADFSGLLQAGLQRFRHRGLRIRPVGEVEVDIIGIQATQRVVNRLLISFAEPFMAGEA